MTKPLYDNTLFDTRRNDDQRFAAHQHSAKALTGLALGPLDLIGPLVILPAILLLIMVHRTAIVERLLWLFSFLPVDALVNLLTGI